MNDAQRTRAFAARPDVAKCSGIGCDSRETCLRYLRPDASITHGQQVWAAFYANLPECGGYVPADFQEGVAA